MRKSMAKRLGSHRDQCLLIGAKLTSTYRCATIECVRQEHLRCGYSEAVQGYDFNRMVFEFTMLNQGKVFCARSAPRRWTILTVGVT